MHRIVMMVGAVGVVAGCCGARASGEQYKTPNGVTVYVKCRSEESLCYDHAALLCGSRHFKVLSKHEERGGTCTPAFGFTNTWYKMNIACTPPPAQNHSAVTRTRQASQPKQEHRQCDSARKASERTAAAESPMAEQNMGTVESRALGDLDHDGLVEYAIDRRFKVATTTTILAHDPEGCARAVLKDGLGVVTRVLDTRTNGWSDIELGVTLNPMMGAMNACSVALLAKYDGKRYRIRAVLSVSQVLEGGQTDLDACREQASGFVDK